MAMSVVKRLGFTHVRGGRILRLLKEHEVSTRSYDHMPDLQLGQPRRQLPPVLPARVGDLAVEVISVQTDRVQGYMYLSGEAINLIHYTTHDQDADRFATGVGTRFALEVSDAGRLKALLARACAVGDVSASCLVLQESDDIQSSVQAIVSALQGNREDACADLLLKVQAGRVVSVLHLQGGRRSQQYYCHPFAVEVVLSSPELRVLSDLAVPSEQAAPN